MAINPTISESSVSASRLCNGRNREKRLLPASWSGDASANTVWPLSGGIGVILLLLFIIVGSIIVPEGERQRC